MNKSGQARPSSGRNTRRYALVGAFFGLMFPVIATGVSMLASGLPLNINSVLQVQAQPLMWIIYTAPFFLGAFAAFAGFRQDRLEAGSRGLADQTRRLTENQRALEQRVADRTEELQLRDDQMRSTVQITRRVARIQDVAQLAETAVGLIAENHPDFIAELYMIDERRSEALCFATSEAGASPPPPVKVGGPGLIGQASASGQPTQLNTGDGPQLALPLLSRGRSIGVLLLRAAHPDAVIGTHTEVFQLLADHLAAAIETTRLFNQARESLQQMQDATGATADAGSATQRAPAAIAFEFTPAGVREPKGDTRSLEPAGLRVPIELRGKRIGAIALARGPGEGWTDADRDLAQKTAAQVALALENVRLIEETRQRARQEQTLSEFSARLSQSVDLDSLLQTAVRELAGMPDVLDASIVLSPTASSSGSEPAPDSAE